jgi:hypothetical protein
MYMYNPVAATAAAMSYPYYYGGAMMASAAYAPLAYRPYAGYGGWYSPYASYGRTYW